MRTAAQLADVQVGLFDGLLHRVLTRSSNIGKCLHLARQDAHVQWSLVTALYLRLHVKLRMT